MRPGIAAGVLTSLAALPAQTIDVALSLPPSFAFGDRFEVVVTRRWPGSLSVEAFDPAQLAPLSVTPLAVELLADGERRRYTARALVAGKVELAPVMMRWLEGDSVHTVACTVPPFVVASLLPEPPGELEWPADVLSLPRASVWSWLALLMVAAAGVAWWWWRRPLPTVMAPPPAADAWHAGAELDRLRPPAPGQDTAAFFVALKAIVREHCRRVLALPAPVRTSEELVAAVTRGGGELQAALRLCDQVLFAAAAGETSPELALARARAFVEASS